MSCNHDWETGHDGWGVVIGVSRCKRCGKLSEASDFHRRHNPGVSVLIAHPHIDAAIEIAIGVAVLVLAMIALGGVA